MRTLLDSIDTSELIGLGDRALIAFVGCTFASVGAAVQMKVEDYYIHKRRGWVRLHEKGSEVNGLSCHQNRERFMDEWSNASGPLSRALLYMTNHRPRAASSVSV